MFLFVLVLLLPCVVTISNTSSPQSNQIYISPSISTPNDVLCEALKNPQITEIYLGLPASSVTPITTACSLPMATLERDVIIQCNRSGDTVHLYCPSTCFFVEIGREQSVAFHVTIKDCVIQGGVIELISVTPGFVSLGDTVTLINCLMFGYAGAVVYSEKSILLSSVRNVSFNIRHSIIRNYHNDIGSVITLYAPSSLELTNVSFQNVQTYRGTVVETNSIEKSETFHQNFRITLQALRFRDMNGTLFYLSDTEGFMKDVEIMNSVGQIVYFDRSSNAVVCNIRVNNFTATGQSSLISMGGRASLNATDIFATNITSTNDETMFYAWQTAKIFARNIYIERSRAIIGSVVTGRDTTLLQLQNVTVVDSESGAYGGVATAYESSRLILIDVVVMNTRAVTGGFIHAKETSNVNLQNVNVTNSSSAKVGGVIAASDYATIQLRRVHITNAWSTQSGGALYASDFTTVVADDLRVVNTSCLNVTISAMSSCDAVGNGGVVSATGHSVLNLSNVVIDNVTSGCGGAFFVGGSSKLTVATVTFVRASSTQQGGVLYAAGLSNVDMNNVVVERSWSGVGGGAFWIGGEAYLSVTNVTSINTTARGYGGFVAGVAKARVELRYVTLTISSVLNEVNDGDDGVGGHGGGVLYCSPSSYCALRDVVSVTNVSSVRGVGGFAYIEDDDHVGTNNNNVII
eukprot:PhF_6_TR17017/c1_g1_i6/m.25809